MSAICHIAQVKYVPHPRLQHTTHIIKYTKRRLGKNCILFIDVYVQIKQTCMLHTIIYMNIYNYANTNYNL